MGEQIQNSVDDLVAVVPDGAKVAVVKDECGVAMEATRALIRKGVKRLYIVTVPTSGLQTDMLVGAGATATVETSAVTFGEFGAPPNFVRAVKAGTVQIKDATCPAVYAGLQASEKGIPFMPMRGLIGSDIEGHRDEFKVIDNPFATDDPIIALPAIQPDFALIHAPLADRYGNIWIGRERSLLMMAHASRDTLATVEETVTCLMMRSWPLGVFHRFISQALPLRRMAVGRLAFLAGTASMWNILHYIVIWLSRKRAFRNTWINLFTTIARLPNKNHGNPN
ncbi:MAG: CoA transferase subunit A [Rhodospirillales bacterium]